MRSHFTQLPSVNETNEILLKEAKRSVPVSKLTKHYTDFSSVISWLHAISVSSRIFEKPVTWQEAMGMGGELQAEVVSKTVELYETIQPILTQVTDYLGETDEVKASDVILVYGSKDLHRVAKAVELWHQGCAKTIIMSGGRPNYAAIDTPSEAELFKQEAMRLGVPESAILTEPNSLTVPDNTRSTLNLLDEKGIEYNRIILVISWFAMRRAWVHLMKYGSEGIKVYKTCNIPHKPACYPHAWYTNEEGIQVIFNEFVKMRVAECMNTA